MFGIVQTLHDGCDDAKSFETWAVVAYGRLITNVLALAFGNDSTQFLSVRSTEAQRKRSRFMLRMLM